MEAGNKDPFRDPLLSLDGLEATPLETEQNMDQAAAIQTEQYMDQATAIQKDPAFNNLFSEDDGEDWIVAKNIDGKVKITKDIQNTTCDGDKTGVNWITLHNAGAASNESAEDNDTNALVKGKEFEMPYIKENKPTGFYFIRDLLNLQKPNDLSDAFIADGKLLEIFGFCARITSIEVKENHRRLIVDDGTSAILCVVKHVPEKDDLQSDNSSSSADYDSNTLYLLAHLRQYRQKLIRDCSTEFDQSDLGVPLMIFGKLKQFKGKNFIYTSNVRRVSENCFKHFINSVIQGYEFRANNVLN